MNENQIDLRPMDLESRRDLIDMQVDYTEYRRVITELAKYRGGMTWKKAKAREYLFKIRDRSGNGSSLGLRSPETEKIFKSFHKRKDALMARKGNLEAEIGKRARVLRARGMGRIPRAGAAVLRVMDREGLLNDRLTVIGTYALYAYEAKSGVHFKQELLSTGDVDILYDSRKKLLLWAKENTDGMLGLLKKADRSFKAAGKGHFRAVNDQGFMVEFLTQASENVVIAVPAEMSDVRFLLNAPKVDTVALDEGGRPVFMRAPDPRYFAMNKLWMASKSDRDRLKARRDDAQARAVTALCVLHLGLAFDKNDMRSFPANVRARTAELVLALEEPGLPGNKDSFEPSF